MLTVGNSFKFLNTVKLEKSSQVLLKQLYQPKLRAIMTESNIEKGKEAAAHRAVDENVHGDCIVGVGSGSTMTYVLERLNQLCNEKNYKVKCIPTSFQSKQLIKEFGFHLTDLDSNPEIDITIDGADEVDENLVAIKGGGACLAQEKVVGAAARRMIVVADWRKDCKHLGQTWKKGIPIEVLPMATNYVRSELVRLLKTKLVNVSVRVAKEKAGPVITDNGNFVLDWRFQDDDQQVDNYVKYSDSQWQQLSNKIKLIPGVVEVGIFAGIVSGAYFGNSDGSTRFQRYEPIGHEA